MLFGILSTVLGYLLGSFPSAYIITKLNKGIDIREVDTGNVGAASTARVIGIGYGIFVGFLDAAKGYLAVYIAHLLGVHQFWVYAAGFAALLGHNFPVFIGFRGGQGVSTIIGIFLFLTPLAAFCTLFIIFVLLVIQYRVYLDRIFLSILVSSPTLPVFIWILYRSWELTIYSLIIIIFIMLRNIPRIKDRRSLLSGQKPQQ